MGLETLLTGTKWDIIELLSQQSMSPLELAEKLNTTIANISQQIRLLQTADLVETKKTRTSKPGKPRKLFSLSSDYAFVSIFSKGYAEKKLIKISEKQKQMLKQILEEKKA